MEHQSTREALVKGALRCLLERGYARTTTRDIAAASGANLALIAYYFGSKEALLTEALLEGFRGWVERFERLTAEWNGGDPLEWARAAAPELQRVFEDERPLLVAFVEVLAQAERSEELRAQLADGYEDLRSRSAVVLRSMVGAEDDARLVASLLMALIDGLVVQWLIDPQRAPHPEVLAERVGSIARTGFKL